MKLYKNWCEYNIGLNIDDNIGVYYSKETVDEILSKVCFSYMGCEDRNEMKNEGLLTITEIDG